MRYKSFDQFVSEMDRSEEIEKDIQALSTPAEMDVEDTEAEADKVQTNEAEEKPESEETPSDEAGETKEEQAEEVSKVLERCYESVVAEAKAWETDAHDDHTIESYMCENAALVASLAAKACKDCKDEYGEEAYEAALNMIKEAFSNKIEEVKIALSGEAPADAEEKSAD
jgi:hypothetical protein